MRRTQSDPRIGEHIRVLRQQSGKSQRQLAELAGITQSQLSKIERNLTSADNRFVLAGIAQALCVPVDELTGVPMPKGRDAIGTYGAANDTHRALIMADLEFPADEVTGPPVPALAEHVDGLLDLRRRCDYASLVRRLPMVITSLHSHVTVGDVEYRDKALELLVLTCEIAAVAARYTGQPAVSTLAGESAYRAAQMADNPVILGLAEWTRAHAVLSAGMHERAALVAQRAANRLESAGRNLRGAAEMLGMLYLTSAFSLVGAKRRGDADEYLAEARQRAQRTGETDTFGLYFGPTNVAFWDLAIGVDGGDPGDALAATVATNPAIVDSPSRQATFYLDRGRGQAKLGNTQNAIASIEAAYRIAPQRVDGDPLVRETLAGLLDTSYRAAVGPRLRSLCDRVGVAW